MVMLFMVRLILGKSNFQMYWTRLAVRLIYIHESIQYRKFDQLCDTYLRQFNMSNRKVRQHLPNSKEEKTLKMLKLIRTNG